MKQSQALSLQQIWSEGCRGGELTSSDRQHFSQLARSRFYTFQMSADHARADKSTVEAESWIDGLVRGLARELLDNPGLEREWSGSDFASSHDGQVVTLALTTLPS